jgi:hypothetical protein
MAALIVGLGVAFERTVMAQSCYCSSDSQDYAGAPWNIACFSADNCNAQFFSGYCLCVQCSWQYDGQSGDSHIDRCMEQGDCYFYQAICSSPQCRTCCLGEGLGPIGGTDLPPIIIWE